MRAFTFALTASLVVASPALADPSDFVSVHISHSDIDLSTPSGVAKLKARSARAIRHACAPETTIYWSTGVAEQRCRADAMAQANQQIEQKRRTSVALVTAPGG